MFLLILSKLQMFCAFPIGMCPIGPWIVCSVKSVGVSNNRNYGQKIKAFMNANFTEYAFETHIWKQLTDIKKKKL